MLTHPALRSVVPVAQLAEGSALLLLAWREGIRCRQFSQQSLVFSIPVSAGSALPRVVSN